MHRLPELKAEFMIPSTVPSLNTDCNNKNSNSAICYMQPLLPQAETNTIISSTHPRESTKMRPAMRDNMKTRWTWTGWFRVVLDMCIIESCYYDVIHDGANQRLKSLCLRVEQLKTSNAFYCAFVSDLCRCSFLSLELKAECFTGTVQAVLTCVH